MSIYNLRNKVKPEIFEFSRYLRKNPTPQEKVLWQAFRRKQLGVKIRRQYVIRGFIADFFCPSANLVIEIDGPIHETKIKYDKWRSDIFKSLNLKIIRFKNEEIENDLDLVISEIKNNIYSGVKND